MDEQYFCRFTLLITVQSYICAEIIADYFNEVFFSVGYILHLNSYSRVTTFFAAISTL